MRNTSNVKYNEMWHLLEQRVSKRGVEQFIVQHDEPPPGVDVSPLRGKGYPLKLHPILS